MKTALITAGACGAAVVIALAAQNRGFEQGGPMGRVASVLDTDRDTVISATEMRSAASALKTLDVNGDGQLTRDELRPAIGGRGPRGDGERGERGGQSAGAGGGASPEDLAETLMAFDRNADGKLERGEVPERFQGLFDRADANKDATLAREELTQSASASVQEGGGRGRRGGEGGEFGRGRGRGGFADPLVRALDSDHDGTISAPELTRAPVALETLDANHDGQLSRDELRPAPPRDGEGRR
jgi:Ca2+-binding EF-hand superfamily protein